ncbi:VWA domain-containing protein [Actinomyces bowdenii]|uniref:GDSL-type esterase/lipase family protein n=1 Tax=Actinomyces bowdenii TaxID=131109 RepID=UPI001ABC1396|nr:GDSL-type esterase/lipase family protein [Actinomyces bowdenii]MBO3725396.1 VWA domain-containing protein [Actinomyces bowdenii]
MALSAFPATTPTARAEATTNTLHITLLGDSYSAGTGAGSYYGEEGSYRSHNNWAHRYVDWINDQGTPAILTNLAFNGDTTQQVLGNEGQVANMPTDSDVVMFTIGGNDVHFSDIVKQCFTLGIRDAKTCKQKVDEANSGLAGVRTNTEKILQEIDNKLPDGAQVILVGYPRLATDDEYILQDSETTYDAGAGVRGLSDAARTVQSNLVNNWNAAHPGLKVTYIDGVINAFSGHEPDPSVKNRNDYRWLNEFFETEGVLGKDGKTESKASKDTNVFYHPNLIGHSQIAELIQSKVGVPDSVSPQDLKGTIDIVFVVDSTGSMQDDAAAARNNIRSIMEQTSKRSSSYRFALVDYKDHPQFNPNNYLARTDVDFTTDPAAIERGFDSLTFEGGNLFNTNATVYSGTMQALGLTWRDGAKKIALVIGDAPPRNPEPGTGYTSESVAKAAYDVDPVSVYGINTNGSLNSPDFQSLVSQSGGTITDAASPDDITGLINQAIDAELNKPFAWIQGPYVAKAGEAIEIDAAASHATKGELTRIEWDFNGDGTYEETSTSTRIQHTFTEAYSGVIGLRVTQTDGQTATATTRVDVTDDGDITPHESDNCPDVNNYGQSDYDGDGIGDDCDADPGFPTQDLPGVCVVGETCSNNPSNTPPSTTPAPSPSADPPSSSAPATPTGTDSSPARGQSGDRAAVTDTALFTQTAPAWPTPEPPMT